MGAMWSQLQPLFFAAVRGMSQTQLLIVAGALLTRLKLWSPQGSREVGSVVAKVLLPFFVFMEFAKPAMKAQLLKAFGSSTGPLIIGLSAAQMCLFLLLGWVVVRLIKNTQGAERCGGLLHLSVAFGNATALPILLAKAVQHLFAPEDRESLMLCVLLYGTINRALMWTAGSAICCGQAKPSLLLNEINVGSAMGLLVAFSKELCGIDLLSRLHGEGNWIDIAGTGQKLADLANPLLLMIAGSNLSKGPNSEDLDTTSIVASTVARLCVAVPVSLMLLKAVGILGIKGGDAATRFKTVLGFVLLLESSMPAAAQLALVAQEGGDQKAVPNMSALLFWHSAVSPVSATLVLSLALKLFATGNKAPEVCA